MRRTHSLFIRFSARKDWIRQNDGQWRRVKQLKHAIIVCLGEARQADVQLHGKATKCDWYCVYVFICQSVKSLSSAPTVIFFTSGTTGNAKMEEHSQASMGLGGTGMRKYVITYLVFHQRPFFRKGRNASTYDNHTRGDKSQGVLSRQRVGMTVGKFVLKVLKGSNSILDVTPSKLS